MGFPLDHFFQLLQKITYHFLPIHGLGGECTFPVALLKVCQWKLSACSKSLDHSKTKAGTVDPMDSPLTLDNLTLQELLSASNRRDSAAEMPPPDLPRSAFAIPVIVSESRKSPPAVKHSREDEGVAEPSVQRSMARRKKNEPPMDINKKCEQCGKIFKRPCDFTKHEKTHSRPWKCTVPECKFYEHGWPTEKERDRHINDRHSPNPPEYHCKFDPCTYTSKRESNLKQHMEKAHGWEYVRSKNNGKRGKTPSSSVASPNLNQMVLQTPPTPAMSTPISSLSTRLSSPASAQMTSPYITDASMTSNVSTMSSMSSMSSMSTMSNVQDASNMSNDPPIYNPNTYYDGFYDPRTGQHFNFNDPPMVPTSDFQLYPDTDLSTIGLEPFQNSEEFANFNSTLEPSEAPSDLLSAPPSADMTMDQLGQDQHNRYIFDNEFYNYQ